MTSSKEDHVTTLPSTISWSQTLDSITLEIKINHVQVMITERYLKLSVTATNHDITLPLYNSLYIQQFDIEQMSKLNTTTLSLTLEKEFPVMWPHLLMQQTDQEMSAYLLEADFSIHIYQYDTLDFETVINGHGEKTGLE